MQQIEQRLQPDFQFSQSSLQDFVDCQRRFQLRYIQRLAWPALETEPVLDNERFLQKGSRFHRLVQQHVLGVPEENLEKGIQEPELARWWEHYLGGALKTIGFEGLSYPANLLPEISISAPMGNYRLIAKYDLLVNKDDGHWLIVDWKTSRKRPRRDWLLEKLQTYVYPYLLVRAGTSLNGGQEIEPLLIEMVYWFADFPDQPERISYSEAKFQTDENYLQSLLARISRLKGDAFRKTDRLERCAYCVYRSLCERGSQAGSIDEYPDAGEGGDTEGFELDFDQIAEIEF
jgi:CRISPR/Cas system-associated exonuclease Cas4 (RecB family)